MNIRSFPTTPAPNKVFPYLEDPAVSFIEYEDSGMDYNLDGTCAKRFFRLTYESPSPEEAALLDAHNDEAQGEAATFMFTDPFTGLSYAGVRYAEYEVGRHTKSFSPIRNVLLVQELV